MKVKKWLKSHQSGALDDKGWGLKNQLGDCCRRRGLQFSHHYDGNHHIPLRNLYQRFDIEIGELEADALLFSCQEIQAKVFFKEI